MDFRWVVAGLVLSAAGTCGVCQTTVQSQPAAARPAAPTAQAVPLIPRATLFGNPDKSALRVSPDGKHISWLAPSAGVMNVWVAPIDKPADAKVVTNDTSRGIRQYFWAFTNDRIIYLQDKGGDENWKVFVVDVASGKEQDLTPFEEIPGPDGKPMTLPNGKPMRPTAQMVSVSRKSPGTILVGLNNRDAQFHDVHSVDIATGKTDLVFKNTRFAEVMSDEDYALRLAMINTPDGGQEIFRNTAQKGSEPVWETFQKIPQGDSMTTSPATFDKTGSVLYMTDSRDRNTGALTAVDLKTGKVTVLAEDPRVDAGQVVMHPTERTVQAVSFNYLKNSWKVLDPSIQADLDYLKTVANGEIGVTSRTLDDTLWTVTYVVDNGPARSYLYDRKAKKATFVFSNNKALESATLAPLHPVVIKSRDGMELVSYLTLPVGSDPDANARPAAPLPMVLLVHGGPWGRDGWGYNPLHQWLANRGYAVLSVNFRGSTGFGKAFVNAADKEWAGKMHDDLIDAVEWSVKERIADSKRVAIMGGSYGGYATLVGLTFTPEVFACGVDIVGPSSIVTLLNTIPPYWKPMIEMFATRVGDHRTEEGRKFLESRSPLTRVGEIKRPLLIGQGANDPRVKQSEADQIVAAMESKRIPVTYVLYPDEGHGFARPQNRTSFNAVVEAFLSRHLGGRYEPVGSDFKGSSITVPVGADQVPGLQEAMKG